MNELDDHKVVNVTAISLHLERDLLGEARVTIDKAFNELLHLEMYGACCSCNALAKLRFARFWQALDHDSW